MRPTQKVTSHAVNFCILSLYHSLTHSLSLSDTQKGRNILFFERLCSSCFNHAIYNIFASTVHFVCIRDNCNYKSQR